MKELGLKMNNIQDGGLPILEKTTVDYKAQFVILLYNKVIKITSFDIAVMPSYSYVCQ